MSDTTITSVLAWEALDSRGRPTVAVAIRLADGTRARAVVPSGASTGTFEAKEARDGGSRYQGYGVRQAVSRIAEEIAPELTGQDAGDQRAIDQFLRTADGTPNFGRLGSNAVLALSLAVYQAAHASEGHSKPTTSPVGLPLPMFNIISGGMHAKGALDIQDLLVIPVGATNVAEAIEWGSQVREATAALATERGLPVALVADEGGLGPPLDTNRDGLELLNEGIKASGLTPGTDVAIAVDVAATQLLDKGQYLLRREGISHTPQQWLDELIGWLDSYPIVSVEDPFGDEDWASWAELTARVGDRVQIVGDDLFVTDRSRLERGLTEQSANAVLVKPNQIGTVSDAEDLVETATQHRIRKVVSARSGDTEDSWLVDLAVGWNAEQLKVGSLTRSERTAKWNRLLELEADPSIPTVLRKWTPLARS